MMYTPDSEETRAILTAFERKRLDRLNIDFTEPDFGSINGYFSLCLF